MLGKALARTDDLVVQESGNDLLIYDLKKNKAYSLNQTSALVWQFCDGNNTVAEISDKLTRKLGTDITEDFVWLALDQFSRDELLESDEAIANHFSRTSRRAIIKNVGFASVIALPLVASVIAPSAASAQTLLANCSPCMNPGQCAGGFCGGATMVFPDLCGAGMTNNFPAGVQNLGCCANQPDCDVWAGDNCCSGSGTFVAPNCVCD